MSQLSIDRFLKHSSVNEDTGTLATDTEDSAEDNEDSVEDNEDSAEYNEDPAVTVLRHTSQSAHHRSSGFNQSWATLV